MADALNFPAGTVALVTGGSRGIGRATAMLLARLGADVGVTWHTRKADAEDVTREIRAMGRKAFAAGGDLGDPAVVERVFREFKACFGRLDYFVANAGVWPVAEVALRDMDDARWRSVLTANLDAVFLTTRAALRLMGPGGRVVLVGSTAGQRGEGFHADYAASKGALISLDQVAGGRMRAGHHGQLRGPGLGGHRDGRRTLCRRGPCAHRAGDPPRPCRQCRRYRRPDRLPAQRPRPACHRRSPERERRKRVVWLTSGMV